MTEPPRQQATIAGLFPTPVLTAALAEAAALNPALRGVILAREQGHPSVSHSNLGGWQSDTQFLDWGGAPAKRLLAIVTNAIDQMTADRAGRAVKIDWHSNGWANVNRSGHGNEFHTHPGCFWSAVYYVDDGGIGADPALGGELELADPRGVAPAMHAPHVSFALRGGQSAGVSELVRPHSGLLVVFPSWLSHAVRPYRGSGIRISIAINFSVQPALVPRLA